MVIVPSNALRFSGCVPPRRACKVVYQRAARNPLQPSVSCPRYFTAVPASIASSTVTATQRSCASAPHSFFVRSEQNDMRVTLPT